MKDDIFEDIYLTLLGELAEKYKLPGVENAFVIGGECDRLYNEIVDARDRLHARLGVQAEDPDLELIFNHFHNIQHILCEKMFRYGQLCGR